MQTNTTQKDMVAIFTRRLLATKLSDKSKIAFFSKQLKFAMLHKNAIKDISEKRQQEREQTENLFNNFLSVEK